MMPLNTLPPSPPKKNQRGNITCISLRYWGKSGGKSFSPFWIPNSLKRLVRCADQQKTSVTCQKCVMVNPVFAPMIDSESMASHARMGRATA